MDEMNLYNKHYITVNDRGLIIDGFSDAFRQPSETDICINEQGSYQFRLIPGGCENPPLRDWTYGIPMYKYENSEVFERTKEEINADISALPKPEYKPSTDERLAMLEEENALLKAQVTAQSDQMDFYEDCIAEMAAVVYA